MPKHKSPRDFSPAVSKNTSDPVQFGTSLFSIVVVFGMLMAIVNVYCQDSRHYGKDGKTWQSLMKKPLTPWPTSNSIVL